MQYSIGSDISTTHIYVYISTISAALYIYTLYASPRSGKHFDADNDAKNLMTESSCSSSDLFF